MLARLNLRSRLRAAGLHLLVSAAFATLAATLVFDLWYPDAYRLLAGGRDLFLLVVSVDVVLGPLLTFAVFNPAKGWPHLRRDLAVIGLLQLGALLYGLHTVYIARPVALVFEVDRLRVVAADAVYTPELPQALPQYRSLPLTGPWLLAARAARPGEERNQALFMALGGADTGQRPLFWQPYSEARDRVLARSRPVAVLLAHDPAHSADLATRLRAFKLDPQQARFLPVIARGDWVALLRPNGEVAGFAPYDGFF
ncbi:TfpX/TfpZ family type IV pilin accessory protein [Rhodoferax sediminis]|jgi:hypothetical protein|uniref:Pilus assembly protein n=1 Tax=Rhodoferax sediminis TaxID=2509614 RepID=A0A515D699_9BURK|nr:TfpX/TfpZ family type IV pilin accessory protein [Rhodoferax sediminis]QDL35935.1 pilus assembly protein [Rhodoferax sediminis]